MDKDEVLHTKSPVLESKWQRLSPISIIYFTVRSVLGFANNFFYLLPVIALNFSKIKEQPFLVVAVAVGILSLFFVIGLLKYLFYQFRLGDARVEIKQGIFKKSHIDLPFERIQNVKLSQPFYYRFSDFSCIELDTAGSAKQEAKIVALKTSDAERFRISILNTVKTKSSESEGQVESTAVLGANDEVVLNRRSIKDLIIHGITNNRIWIFLGALAPFYNAISDNFVDIFESIGFDAQAYFSLQTQAWWEFSLHVFSLVMAIMLIVVLFSVVGSILIFYKYTLSKANDRYVRRSGLLTKHEVSMKLSRIQILVQAQDWLDVLLGRVNLTFEQNTTGRANANKPGEQMANKLLVPSVTVAESQTLMKDAMPTQTMATQTFKAISKRAMFRNILLYALPFSALVFAILVQKGFIGGLLGLAIFVLAIGIAFLRWKRWGYSFDEEYIYIRKGFLGVNYYCFPIYKAQQVQFKQNMFMRPYSLASLKVVLASGAMTVPYISDIDVRLIVNSILNNLVEDKRSWM